MYLTLIFLAALLLPIPVMIQAMRKRLSPYRAVLEGIIAGVIGAIVIMILSSVSGSSIFSTIQESIRYMAEILSKDASIIEIMGKETTEAERFEFITELYGHAADLLPSSICIFTAIAAYIEYIILSKIVKPGGTPAYSMTKFREFDLPRNVLFGWLSIFLLSWIITKTGIMPNDLLYVNINALFNFVFCLQGMSVIFKFCFSKRAPKIIAVIIIIFFLLTGFGKLALMILGFADVIFKLKEKLR